MGEIVQINGEYVSMEKIDELKSEILTFLKSKKQTYAVNKSVLKYALEQLEKEVNSIVFH